MPTNNFKLFDENKANMMSDTDYAANQQRLNGVQSGIASSQLQNKTLYQTSLMCYALAQLMAANGYDANDANSVSTFVNNLSLTTLQKVVDKASAADIASKNANKWVPASLFGQNMDTIGETYLKLAGGTMTGNLILNSDPTQSLQAATKQYVDKRARIAVGSYVGNGTFGVDNPVIINCGFRPVFAYIFRKIGSSAGDGSVVGFMQSYNNGHKSGVIESFGNVFASTFYYRGISSRLAYNSTSTTSRGSINTNFVDLEDGFKMYADSSGKLTADASYQMNEDGVKYYWIALGSDLIVQGEKLIFEDSQTFVIPATGRYNIEIHGAGGNGYNDNRKNSQYGGSGGGSGELYSNINFTSGQEISVIIGKAASGDGISSFGSYSVAKGGNGGKRTAGVASGNLATAGVAGTSSGGRLLGGSGGSTKNNYGTGASVAGDGTISGQTDGGIILTYIGE